MLVFSITTYANKSRWDEYKAQWSELMLAIYKGQADTYNVLINQGVNLNYKTSDYKLSALSVAIYKEDDKAVKALVQTKKIKNLSSYLMTAAQCSNASTINILMEFGADPNMKNENGHTALMSAVSVGSYNVLVCLLKHGAKVNQNRKVDGMTPLMFAAFNGDLQKTKLLLEYHADKGLRDHDGKIALDYVEMIYPRLEISEKIKTEIRLLLTIDKKTTAANNTQTTPAFGRRGLASRYAQ